MIGPLASILGLFPGLLLALGMKFFKAVNNDLPTTGLIVAPQTVIVSLLDRSRRHAGSRARSGGERDEGAADRRRARGRDAAARAARPVPAVHRDCPVALAIALLAYGMFAGTLATAVRLLSLALGCLVLFIGVALLRRGSCPTLSARRAPDREVGDARCQPARLSDPGRAWLSGAASTRAGSRRCSGRCALVGGLLMLLVIGPGVLLAAAWAMRYLSTAIGWGFVAAVLVTEVVLVVWVVVSVVRRLRRRGYASDLPGLRFDPATDRLSGENTRRNPGRTAATAAALMIGLALVTFIAVLANGMKQSNRRAIERQVKSSYMLVSAERLRLDLAERGRCDHQGAGGCGRLDVRSGVGKASGSVQQITGSIRRRSRRSTTSSGRTDRTRQSTTSARTRRSSTRLFADKKNLSVGSRFDLLTSSGKTVPLEVKGVYKAPPFYPLLGEVSISLPFFDRLYERPKNLYTFVDVKSGPSASAQAGLKRRLANFPDAKVETRGAWIHAQDKDFDNFLLLLYVLLALAVIVSLVGMINTLVLSVFERTRELGMLRAVGMTRNQVSRMVRQESVITALIGAALGLPLGVFLAVLVTRALSQFNVEFVPPWKNLIGFAIVAMIAGVLAAVAPARRASRLNVLRALQYE